MRRAPAESRFSTARQSRRGHFSNDATGIARGVPHLCNRDRAYIDQNRFGLCWIVAVRSRVKTALAWRWFGWRRLASSREAPRMSATGEDGETHADRAEAVRAFYEFRIRIPRRSATFLHAATAIETRIGAGRNLFCCGPWRSRDQRERSWSPAVGRHKPPSMRSPSPTPM